MMRRLALSLSFVVCMLLCTACSTSNRRIDIQRRQVWTAWCKALAADTLPMPSLRPLAERDSFVWHIPDSLEESADMAFRYGTKGDEPADGYPLILYLHGSGPRDAEWEAGWRFGSRFVDSSSLYYIPRIPREDHYRWYPRSKQWAWEQLIRKALASGHVDPARLYLIGISEGGYGGQRLASFYADYLAGAGPMAGGEPLRNAPPENLGNIAFSLLTGENDRMFFRNMLTETTGQALDSLHSLHPDRYVHRVELEPGRGHGIDYYRTTPWLMPFTRNARPDAFTWENYEMDGRKRNNFYNLEVLAEDSTATRVCYDYIKEDNHIVLRVDAVTYETTFTDPWWGIEMKFKRYLQPVSTGHVRIYLDADGTALREPVTVSVNGSMQNLRATISKKVMQRSCALWGDPLRLYPACIDVSW